jgi:hypothetical protein
VTGLILAALLAQADVADAGVRQLYSQCPDAPLVVAVDGGFFTPELRQRRENCKLAACEDYANAKLAESAPGSTSSPGVVLSLVGGGLALVALAVVAGYLLPHPAK